MARYSIERREWVVRQMMPPLNRTVVELVEETGISDVTLYAWRKQARAAGVVVPGDGNTPDGWSSEEKFRVVLESAALSESELGEYCRRKALACGLKFARIDQQEGAILRVGSTQAEFGCPGPRRRPESLSSWWKKEARCYFFSYLKSNYGPDADGSSISTYRTANLQ